MLQVQSPFQQFFDTAGSPLSNGTVYVGTAGQNPETNPIQLYWDIDGTQPVAQPIRTTNGYLSRTGTPARVFCSENDFSMTVKDSKGRFVFTAASATSFGTFVQTGVGATQRNALDKMREQVSVFDFMTEAEIAMVKSYNGGSYVDVAIQKALDSSHKIIYFPPGLYPLANPLQIKNIANSFGKTLYGSKSQTYLEASAGMETIFDILKGADGALSMVIRDMRFTASGAYTGWCIRALGTGTLIDSRIEGCWFDTGSLSAGTFYGKTVFSSFINNVHELTKVFAHCTLASAATFINNKFFEVYDEMFHFDGTSSSNGIVIDGVNMNGHNRGSFIRAVNTANLIVSNVDYQAQYGVIPDSNYFCTFIELLASTATVNNCRVISNLGTYGAGTAYRVAETYNISTGSKITINNSHAELVGRWVKMTGENYVKLADSTLDTCSGDAIYFMGGNTGRFEMKDCVLLNVGGKPIGAASLCSVDMTIQDNFVKDPNRNGLNYCWELFSNGVVTFKDNVTKVSDALVTYWFMISSSVNYAVYIDGNSFSGTPTVGYFRPGSGPYNLGFNNHGLGNRTLIGGDPTGTGGTYQTGDRVFNSGPSDGAPLGWVCTAGGTPGTWHPFGQNGFRQAPTAPATNSIFIGEEYLDTNTNKWYKSKSTGSGAGDWVALN